ncbi:hypothetical protein BDA99DRAFT_546220 [Phascolomyces articulosus]|uniref:Actin-related protein 10 n=1 Tax=Phascolomyces articulosus TaxID=60185 RepID=A0AAD5KJU6_9FUNG|nr:hypothetical protein BDA99DRAFT_546220 [Phascolomyces articulosus]
MALLTTGTTTGLVIDCGNLETTVLPVRRALSQRLESLLLNHGRFIPPSHLQLSLAPQNPVPQSVLTPSLLENLKATVLFCSPLMMDKREVQSDPIAGYKNFSSATDVYYPVVLEDGTKATLLIPGWIRERAAEVLFEGDEEDEPSIIHCILNAILRVQSDLRRPLMSSLLLNGGTSLIPGFQSRLKQELLRVMRDPTKFEKKRYASLLRLQNSVRFIDSPEDNKGAGRIFMNNVRGWIGGSLMGSLKLSGEELAREKYKGVVTDWSINHWTVTPPSGTSSSNNSEMTASSPT